MKYIRSHQFEQAGQYFYFVALFLMFPSNDFLLMQYMISVQLYANTNCDFFIKVIEFVINCDQ